MLDFEKVKRKKERGQSNKEFLDWVISNVIDFDEIAIVVKHPNSEIETYFSQNSSLSLVGTLEVAKQQIINDMEC